MTRKRKSIGVGPLVQLLIVAAILAVGLLGLVLLPLTRQEPAQAERDEQALYVDVLEVHPEAAPVTITGYGEVRPVAEVPIAAEVTGTLLEVHPRLHVGELIPQGETLFRVDPRTYETRVADAQGTVDQLRGSIDRIRAQQKVDRQRIATLDRNRELAATEYGRVKTLFEQDAVGTQSGVDTAEQALNAAENTLDLVRQQLEVYPAQLREMQAQLKAAQARLKQAQIDLDRTAATAPFDARVKSETIEQGQYVAPGNPLLTLADDSLLEISVPLNSNEARQWLKFNGGIPSAEKAWFAGLSPVDCTIRWTEEPDRTWTGQLHRVEKVDETTRTISVAIRIDGEHAQSSGSDSLPLVEGMFCEVAIPGRVMQDVYQVPRSAVTFQGTVYVAREGRLATVPVRLAHEEGSRAYLTQGLEPGDRVIVTRLVNPLENVLLETNPVTLEEALS